MARSPKRLADYDAAYARSRRRRRVLKPLFVLLVVVIVAAGVAALAHGHKKSPGRATTATTYPTQLLTVSQATTPTVITNHSTCGSVAAVGQLLADLKSSVTGVPTYVSGKQTFYENYEQAFALDDSAADEAIESSHNSHSSSLAATVSALNNLALAQHNVAVTLSLLVNPSASKLNSTIARAEIPVNQDIATFGSAWSKESLKYNC